MLYGGRRPKAQQVWKLAFDDVDARQPLVEEKPVSGGKRARHLLELLNKRNGQTVVAIAQREELGVIPVLGGGELGYGAGIGNVRFIAARVLHELVTLVAEHAIEQVP